MSMPLRLMTCGSVLGGKSTLIRHLVEGSSSTSPARGFAVEDLPGDDHCTPKCARELIAAALRADVALVLVDAHRGLDAQARRHSHLASMLGIPSIVVAVNKVDLVGYAQDVFDRIASQFQEFARAAGMRVFACIPTSALTGENVVTRSAKMPWYRGPTLLAWLDAARAPTAESPQPFRMAVDASGPAGHAPRAISGRILSGAVSVGDRLRSFPSGREAAVARIAVGDADPPRADAPQSVVLTLADDIDSSGASMLADARSPPGLADQFEATIFWTSNDAMLPGRAYALRCPGGTAEATLSVPKYGLNLDTLAHESAKTLALNEVGVCNLHLDRPVAFDAFTEIRKTGLFTLSDRFTNETIGTGLLHFALRRSQNIHWQAIEVDKAAHRALKGHRSCVVWFTGLSGAGKSTIANLVEKNLHASGLHTYLLDGDNVRHGLNMDLGFTQADRVENIRRVAEVARLMADAGLIVLVSFISPFRAERRFARGLLGSGEFCEVFVDAPLHVAEARDRKGLYKKARSGELLNFTGIDSPYEPPEHPDVAIDTTSCPPDAAAERVVARLREMGVFGQARSRGA